MGVVQSETFPFDPTYPCEKYTLIYRETFGRRHGQSNHLTIVARVGIQTTLTGNRTKPQIQWLLSCSHSDGIGEVEVSRIENKSEGWTEGSNGT